jgi:prolyl oligopeptidase
MKNFDRDNSGRVRQSLFAFAFVAVILALAAVAPFLPRAFADGKDAKNKITYPETKKVDVVDDYFGTKVADPYRWLEDETSAETKAWIEDQNRVTFG